MIGGFRDQGWQVEEFIVGDRMPLALGVQAEANNWTLPRRVAADVLRGGIGWTASVAAAWKLKGKVDVVYERLASLQAMGRPFQPRVPWILETNALHYQEAHTDRQTIAFSGVARSLERWAYHKCDLIVAVSKPLRDLIEKEAGVSGDKILIVPNGVDAGCFQPGQHAPVRFFDEPTVGFVGTLSNWQSLDDLLRATVALNRSGDRMGVVLVGDGQVRTSMESLARDLRVEDLVRFAGRVDASRIPALISGFDICFSGQRPPSIGQMYHSPLKLYEYLAMGKPVVASAYDDARAVVEEGVTGFLYDPLREGDLERALRSALNARGRWVEMGRVARERVVGEHTWTHRARQVLDAVAERGLCRK
jgi:glycosyltransferase involved in cell wall biosynthesis